MRPRSAGEPAAAAVRTVFVGGADEPLRGLLGDVFAEMGFALQRVPPWQPSPHLVLAAVHARDVARVLAAAHDLAGGAPILALLPFSDDRLARRALEAGAHAWYALDTPLRFLREEIAALLARELVAEATVGGG